MHRFKILPHIITSGNLICGCLAIYFVLSGFPALGAALILTGALLDFFDGFVARMLNVQGELGKQLDSLADVITFGVAPAFIAVHLLESSPEAPNFPWWMTLLPLIMAAFSAGRLAKFNLDTRQSDQFIGVPTPANALFWISFPLSFLQLQNGWILNSWGESWAFFLMEISHSFYFVILTSLVLSWLLMAEIPLLALKFKNFSWKENQFRFILILLSFLLIVLFGFGALPIVLFLYLILSLISNKQKHEL